MISYSQASSPYLQNNFSMPYFYNKEIETLPLAKLRNLQNERLREQVAYVYDRVPFYKKQLDEHGIAPAAIKGVEDLYLLPFTKKHDLRDNYPFGLLAMPVDQMSRIHCSSGTTGKPTVVAYTTGDLDIFSETMARSLAAAGCRPGMMMQNAYGYGLFTGGLGFHYGAEKLGMTVIPVSGGVTDRQLLLLQDFKAEVLACTPSYAQTLAQEMVKRNIPLDAIGLKLAILGAEPWTEAVRMEVEVGLGVVASNMYGLSEIMGPGVSCEDCHEKGTGNYVWEDHYFPEVVDKDTGEPVPYGEYGVLVFTTLTKKGMPLLRYWTNDITNIYYDNSVKRTHIKMGPIRGRSDDMLIIRGVNLFHTQVEDVLKDIPGLSANYQLIVSRKGTMDSVEVQVELSEKLYHELQLEKIDIDVVARHDLLQGLKHSFGKKIKDNIGLSMEITLLGLDEIPRSEGGKLSRIKDIREK
jgi:phenylacetate-CoA ligase